MKNRKLISENRELLKLICKDIKSYNPFLDETKSKFEQLEIGEFSDEVFNEIKKGPQTIINKYKKKIDEEIKQTGIKSTVIIKSMKSATDDKVNEFYEAVEALLQHRPPRRFNADHPYLELSNISFKNEIFIILQEDQETILDNHCRIYLETEEEAALYKKLETFISSYLDLQKILDDAGFKHNNPRLLGVHGIHEHFLKYDNGKPEIRPEMIKDALNQNERLRRFREKRNETINKRQESESMENLFDGKIEA